ncbi:CHRD domain-containing protein [Flavobacterium sp.]|uniref:CHRD domain-containing protein n=1 Tax=Flavobacterium sp. TaxID=239 RepID=UPI00286DFAE2|nr:CHRD domain-containing protein [Flavobacterium sp.]
MKNLFKIAAFTFFLTLIISCDKDDAVNDNVTFTATLSGANEVPANTSTAVGTATLVYNKTTKMFTIAVVHSGLTPTGGHIHKGAAGTNGGVVFGFTNLASPISYTSGALTAEQEADLNAGLYYVNLHTAAIPSGEIRGNLVKQ